MATAGMGADGIMFLRLVKGGQLRWSMPYH